MVPTCVLTLMSDVTEELIEKYIGYPESLDEKSRRLVEHTIRIDRGARMIADFYRAYYTDLRKSDDTSGPPVSREPEKGGADTSSPSRRKEE